MGVLVVVVVDGIVVDGIVVVVVAIVIAIVCLDANLAHSVEQGVDSQELLDYLNRTRNLIADHI